YGLGSDGTVGANKNSVKIIAEEAGLFAQGYFVYDSHKSGAQTVSHLRFGPRPIHAPYLIRNANFVACHQFHFIERQDVLQLAAPGATFLLNSPYGPDEIWDQLPRAMQRQLIEKKIRFYVIDASRVAQESGLRGRANTILQTCFFVISGVLPKQEAIHQIKHAIEKTYTRKGSEVVERNFRAVDAALDHLYEVALPARASSQLELIPLVPADAPDFVRNVTAKMMEGLGDQLPVSALPVDGTYPSATSRWEKRNIAEQVPAWEPDLCIQCGQCSFVCPHSVIRAKYYHQSKLEQAPESFKSAPINVRGFPDIRFSLQFYVEDCTGCGLCVEACPAYNPINQDQKAINLTDKQPLIDSERSNIRFFESLPNNDRARVDFA
ncbi:MAG TPA: 2-oxoacid:acceptor oxidoreductase family protein, partial [Pseudomonadales bacterium]|nr:2-oxoacid:acceptor oxidoreductase family protein [Pseudomonadales bacterium]